MMEKEKERLEKLEQGDKDEPKPLEEEIEDVPKEDLFKMKRFRNVPPRINTNLKKSPAKAKTVETKAAKEEPVGEQAVAVPAN